MISATKAGPSAAARTALMRNQLLSPRSANGGAIAYRGLLTKAQLYSTAAPRLFADSRQKSASSATFLQPPASQLTSLWATLPARRPFHAAATRWEQKKEPESGSQSKEGKESKSEEGKSEDSKQDEAPPPPPHGDKTPWQVFTDTLRSEFKKSKEWNESTKALASSAHQFTESESVKRARAAYEAASGAATSKTASALKTTGKALGQGAAWTWDTTLVKGIRKGVAVTGKGLDKATRPVRETKAYKTAVGGVKEAIDDGSSSRYGGWIEKEERRRQRQLREEAEAKSGRRKVEKMEEDPK